MHPNTIDLTDASVVYAVSNTPLFLVRKLQSDPAVHALSRECSGEEIVEAIRAAVAHEPADSQEAVRPYAYLVALWYKSSPEYLTEAQAVRAPEYSWFSYIASALLQMFNPVQKQLVDVPGYFSPPSVSLSSPANNSFELLNGQIEN